MRRLFAAIVLVVLLATAVGIAAVRDAVYGEPQPVESVLYVRSARFLERASLGNASLVADLYWIRAIQYYGGTRLSSVPHKRYDLLYPLLDIVTTLDPKLKIAYRFGSVFLAEMPPGGPGRPDLAVRLLEKGRRADPTVWEYDTDLGFVYYWYLHDYERAAQAFDRGAQVKGGPWWMRSLAAIVRMKGGDRQGSRRLWQQLYETANDNAWLRNNAALRLAQLDALDQIDQLDAIVSEASRRSGARIDSWGPLVRGGWLRSVPLDPSGAPFVLDPVSGRVTVAPDSKLHPLPTEPGAFTLSPPPR